jgi:hypothetical protein
MAPACVQASAQGRDYAAGLLPLSSGRKGHAILDTDSNTQLVARSMPSHRQGRQDFTLIQHECSTTLSLGTGLAILFQ